MTRGAREEPTPSPYSHSGSRRKGWVGRPIPRGSSNWPTSRVPPSNPLAVWAEPVQAGLRLALSGGYRLGPLNMALAWELRGDPEQRWKAHEIAVKNEILTRNEVREVEGWNPIPET